MSLQGFYYPKTPLGKAGVIPHPPWHYSGQLLTIEYRTDPSIVRQYLPDSVELADEDPGALALIWADWQSCGDDFREQLDPIHSQYLETFLVARCKYQGETYSRCIFIWVDKDFAIARGVHQGYPKKLGSMHITRPVRVGKLGPRMENGTLVPGGKIGATLAAADRRLAEAVFQVEGPSEHTGFVNALPMLHHRWMPRIESDGQASMDEVVTMRGYDAELGPAVKGSATLQMFSSPWEELDALAPKEIIGGYWREVAVSWRGGTTLHR